MSLEATKATGTSASSQRIGLRRISLIRGFTFHLAELDAAQNREVEGCAERLGEYSYCPPIVNPRGAPPGNASPPAASAIIACPRLWGPHRKIPMLCKNGPPYREHPFGAASLTP